MLYGVFLVLTQLYTYNDSTNVYVKYKANESLCYLEYTGVLNTTYVQTIGKLRNSLTSDTNIDIGKIGTFSQISPRLVEAWSDGFTQLSIVHKKAFDIYLYVHNSRISIVPFQSNSDIKAIRINMIKLRFTSPFSISVISESWYDCSSLQNELCIRQRSSSIPPWNSPIAIITSDVSPVYGMTETIDIMDHSVNTYDAIFSSVHTYTYSIMRHAFTVIDDLYSIYNNSDLVIQSPYDNLYNLSNLLVYNSYTSGVFYDILQRGSFSYLKYVQILNIHSRRQLVIFTTIRDQYSSIHDMFKYAQLRIGDTVSDYNGATSFWTGSRWVGTIDKIYNQVYLVELDPQQFLNEGIFRQEENYINVSVGWNWIGIFKNTSLSNIIDQSYLNSVPMPPLSNILRMVDYNSGRISNYYKQIGWSHELSLVEGTGYILYSKIPLSQNTMSRRRLTVQNDNICKEAKDGKVYPRGKKINSVIVYAKGSSFKNCQHLYTFDENGNVNGRGFVNSLPKLHITVLFYSNYTILKHHNCSVLRILDSAVDFSESFNCY